MPVSSVVINFGWVPVATLAESDTDGCTDDDINLTQPAAANIGATSATLPAPKLDHLDRGRLLTAATRARQAYPGPVGELVSRELSSWGEIGFRYGGDSQIAELVAHVMGLPVGEN